MRAFPDAPAIMLEDTTRWTTTESKTVCSITKKILIRRREGFAKADQNIFYDSHQQRLDHLEARTLRADGTVVEVPEALRRNLVWFKNEDRELHRVLLMFPAVEEGCVLEWSYTLIRFSFDLPARWDVQQEIPVMAARFLLKIKTSSLVSLRAFRESRASQKPWCEDSRSAGGPGDLSADIICRKVPAFEREPASPPEADSRLAVYLAVDASGVPSHRDRIWQWVNDDWAKRIKKFAKKREKTAAFARKLVAGAKSDTEKIDRIYGCLGKEIKLRPSFLPEAAEGVVGEARSVDETLDRGGGQPDEVTLLVKVLLDEAGVKNSPVVVNDRSDRRFSSNIADPFQFDHLILQVRPEGQRPGYLDPSCEYCQAGVLDWRYSGEGAGGIVLGAEGTTPNAVTLGAVPAEGNATRQEERIALHANGSAQVQGSILWSGQSDVYQRERWADLTDEAKRRRVTESLPGDIDNVSLTFSDPEDRLENLKVEYAYTQQDRAMVAAGDLLIRPSDAFSASADIPFAEKRDTPLWWALAKGVQVRTEWILPEGFLRPALPPRTSIEGPGLRFDAGWTAGEKENGLTWTGVLLVHATQIPAARYAEAKKFVERLRRELQQGLRIGRDATPVSSGASHE